MSKEETDTPQETADTAEQPKKTYILELTSGSQRRLTVPAKWKVTFGPTTPYETKQSGRYDNCWALRLYEGDKLRAIFTDVRSFRDTSIELLEKRITSKRQVVEKASKAGGKTVVAEAKVEKWVDPDDPDEGSTPDDYLKLAYDPDKDSIETLEF